MLTPYFIIQPPELQPRPPSLPRDCHGGSSGERLVILPRELSSLATKIDRPVPPKRIALLDSCAIMDPFEHCPLSTFFISLASHIIHLQSARTGSLFPRLTFSPTTRKSRRLVSPLRSQIAGNIVPSFPLPVVCSTFPLTVCLCALRIGGPPSNSGL